MMMAGSVLHPTGETHLDWAWRAKARGPQVAGGPARQGDKVFVQNVDITSSTWLPKR